MLESFWGAGIPCPRFWFQSLWRQENKNPRGMMRQPKAEVTGNLLPVWSLRPSHCASSPREALGDPKLGQVEENGSKRHILGFDVCMQRLRES